MRSTPEELLERVRREERALTQGKLTIFFGAAPGVGKTYAMLQAARSELAEGRDVVLGIIETHGRQDTAAQLVGLPILPRRVVEYRGVQIEEFDLDAALVRRPGLILVDELAHTNAEGSRHPKRWQDVVELLDAGLDVYSTLNVQHLQSLNDVVAQVTHVVVRENVPDSLIDNAHEVRLIDLPPDELLERLREGRVYLPAQASRATENFFRKGNLIALRELALRKTAERVDAQLQVYRHDHGIDQPWATTERILVCVSPSPESARLIRAARRFATRLHAPWLAVFVEAPTQLSDREHRCVSDNLNLAEQLGAEVLSLGGADAIGKLLEVASRHNVTKIVLGKPTHPRWRDWFQPRFLDEMIRRSGGIDILVMAGEGDASAPGEQPQGRTNGSAREYVAATLTIAFATGVTLLLFGRSQLADVVMVYLLGIVVVATQCRQGASLWAAILSIICLDLVFIPPYFSFAVSDLRHVVTFGVMFVVASLLSALTQRTRREAEAARGREQRNASLYALSRGLASAQSIEELARVVTAQTRAVFECDAVVLLPTADGTLRVVQGASFAPDQKERGVAEWVWLRERNAGLGTETLPLTKGLYVPLRAARGRVGVLGLVPARADQFRDPEQRQLLDTFVHQIALAIERSLLVLQAQAALAAPNKSSIARELT